MRLSRDSDTPWTTYAALGKHGQAAAGGVPGAATRSARGVAPSPARIAEGRAGITHSHLAHAIAIFRPEFREPFLEPAQGQIGVRAPGMDRAGEHRRGAIVPFDQCTGESCGTSGPPGCRAARTSNAGSHALPPSEHGRALTVDT